MARAGTGSSVADSRLPSAAGMRGEWSTAGPRLMAPSSRITPHGFRGIGVKQFTIQPAILCQLDLWTEASSMADVDAFSRF